MTLNPTDLHQKFCEYVQQQSQKASNTYKEYQSLENYPGSSLLVTKITSGALEAQIQELKNHHETITNDFKYRNCFSMFLPERRVLSRAVSELEQCISGLERMKTNNKSPTKSSSEPPTVAVLQEIKQDSYNDKTSPVEKTTTDRSDGEPHEWEEVSTPASPSSLQAKNGKGSITSRIKKKAGLLFNTH